MMQRDISFFDTYCKRAYPCPHHHDDMIDIAPVYAVSHLTLDSRTCHEKSVYFALMGLSVDGVDYIDQAIQNGTRVIILDRKPSDDFIRNFQQNHKAVLLYYHLDLRANLGLIARDFYKEHPNHMFAVTGTNGKTSTTYYLHQLLWHGLGMNSLVCGTTGCFDAKGSYVHDDDHVTTKDALSLFGLFYHAKQNNIDHVILETSSHGLSQYRVHGCHFSASALTNLSQDHLDYHHTMADYQSAKEILFDELTPTTSPLILPQSNDPTTQTMVASIVKKHPTQQKIYYRVLSKDQGAPNQKTQTNNFLSTIIKDHLDDGYNLHIHYNDHPVYKGPFYAIGDFQIENLMAAIGLSLGHMDDHDLNNEAAILKHFVNITQAIPKCIPPVGRMQYMGKTQNNIHIIIDYAHSPDGLLKALSALRDHFKGKKIGVVFGCGGDRDQGKRPQMGKIAHDHADMVVITDDNPRTEDASTIRAHIQSACPDGMNISDRAEAIHHAARTLDQGSILLIAGKGDEEYQIIGKDLVPYSDLEIARTLCGN